MKKDKQGQSEGFDNCDRPTNLTQIGFIFFIAQNDLEIWRMTLKNNRAPSLCYSNANSGQNRQLSIPCDLEIWQMT